MIKYKPGANLHLYIDIEFEHPIAAGMSDCKTYPATFGLQKFIPVMADELELSPKDIQLAYHLSIEPKSTVPHCLATDENWDRMLSNVLNSQLIWFEKQNLLELGYQIQGKMASALSHQMDTNIRLQQSRVPLAILEHKWKAQTEAQLASV